MENLAEAIVYEQARNRELLVEYRKIPQGAFGAMMIENALREADSAVMSGDVARMIRAYQELKSSE